MNSQEFLNTFTKFCKLHDIEWNKKKRRWNKPFHPTTKNTKIDGVLTTVHTGWKLGLDPWKHSECVYCFKELKGNQKKFCSHKCRVLYTQIRKKAEQMGAFIYWSKKTERGYLQKTEWRDMKVRHPNGVVTNLTRKRGKSTSIYAS